MPLSLRPAGKWRAIQIMTALPILLRIFIIGIIPLMLGASPAWALSVNGQDYVPLTEWARANGFYGFTRNHGDEIVLTNKNSRIVFDVDAAQVEINGINVRLSFPVAGHKTVPAVSQFDVNTVIRPLIFPHPASAKKITTICLDAGHGGKDTGEHVGGFFGRSEKTYTLALALELRDQLKKSGFNVVMTRTTDTFVKLPERAAIANRSGADLFVCLHFNAAQSEKDQIQGPETYCITPTGANSSNVRGVNGEVDTTVNTGATLGNRNESKSLLLAYQLQKSLVTSLNAADRGVKHARFQVLRETAMPGILIEGGFMTHPVEGRKIFDAGYRQQMAAAIVRGIRSYQKLTALPAWPVQPLKSDGNSNNKNR